jgi:hypothetical protein
MLVIVELEGERIRRITIGDRPDFIGGADKMSKTKKEASSGGAVKHEERRRAAQMCHVVAWSILTKRAQRIFKGMTLDEADSWLGEPGNWPDETGMPDSLARRNPSRASGLKAFTLVTKESIQQCPGQVISHTPIGCLVADSCSKALGGRLPSVECSRALL